MSVTDDQQFCLRWNNFQTYITSQFETLRDDEDFVDVTLACDGQRLGAHKVVLSACSPFFKELFKTNPCRHPIVFMRDVEVRHIVALLEFMYAGEVNVAQTHLAGFLRTAESLQIRGLTDAANTKKDNENQIEAQPTSTQLPISPTPPTKPLKSKTPTTTSILKSRISPSRTVTSSQEKSPDSPEPPRKKPKDDETVDANPIDTTTLALRTDLDNSSPELTKSELTQINPFAVETKKLLHSEIDISTDLIEPKLELLDYSEDDLTNPDDKNFLDADQHNSFANLSGGMEIIPGTSGMGDVSQESEQAWDNRKLHSLDPRPCPVCARVYSNLSNLRQHMRLIHNPTHVVCPSCSKSFKTTLYLKRHLVACRGTGQTKKPDAAKLNITTRNKSCTDECQNSPAEPTEFIGTRSMLKRAEDSYLLTDQTELTGRERDFYQSNSPFSKTEPPKLVRIASKGPKTAADNADYFHGDDFFESPANCFENTLTYVSDDAIPNITV